MGWLKKLGGIAKKTGILKAVRGGLAVSTGGASEAGIRAITAAKQLGHYIHPKKPAAQVPVIATPQLQAVMTKVQAVKPAKTLKVPKALQAHRAAKRAVAKSLEALPLAPAKAPTRSAPAKKAGKRGAPSGGLNLKAISAKYRAAGGAAGTGMKWIDYVKANPLRG